LPDASIARVNCTINGKRTVLEGHAMARLLDALRQAGFTGTKEGCGEGECGACGVLLNGELVNSCLTPLAHAEGHAITTIEGIASGATLNAIQSSFLECGGAQCGICTPGMVLATYDLLSRTSHPSEEDVRVALAGNLCRCTGYQRIFAAVLDACGRLSGITRP
jgi:carbon-monoxide dehydrogenase small subunit